MLNKFGKQPTWKFTHLSAMGLLLVCSLILTLSGCRGSTKEEASVDAASEGEKPDLSNGAIDNDAGFKVSLETTDKYTYTLHEGTGGITDNFTAPCSVASTTTASDMTCIVEAKELDLYYHGVALRLNVPQNMCEYVSIARPYHYNFIPGFGPQVVVDNRLGTTAKTIQGVAAAAGELRVGTTLRESIFCDFNYGDENNSSYVKGGPNCCAGKYDVYVSDSSNVVAAPTKIDWGGSLSNCLKGPALQKDWLGQSDGSGYPKTYIENVLSTGFNKAYDVTSPLSQGLPSNAYVANFFRAAEHPNAGGVPSSMRGFSVAAAGTVPAYTVPATNPYHEYVCYDRAAKIKARIRVLVRDWNAVQQFDMGVAGNPDATGVESTFPGDDANDFDDWLDFGDVLAPTATSYPREIGDK
jgi:hypothetical protein